MTSRACPALIEEGNQKPRDTPRAEPLRRDGAGEGVDAADDDEDDGHRCEHAHDEDDVRRLPPSADPVRQPDDDLLSDLAGVKMLSHPHVDLAAMATTTTMVTTTDEFYRRRPTCPKTVKNMVQMALQVRRRASSLRPHPAFMWPRLASASPRTYASLYL